MDSKSSFKKQKFQDRILHELNLMVRTELSDYRLGMISFTQVKLSKDNSYAEITWDIFDRSRRGDAKRAVTSASGKLRTLLAQRMQVRTVPELRFEYDSQFEEEEKIADILKSERSKLEKGE